MSKVAVVAVIFPANLIFFNSFLTSIESQTKTDFDLIIINDGVKNLSENIVGQRKQLIKEIINISGTPFEIRYKAIKEVANRGYQKVIFSDTDDTLSVNRIEVVSNELNLWPIVCNDLDIINGEGKTVEENYWKSRLGERFVFDITFIKAMNIIGFGNSGFRLDVGIPQLDNFPNIIAPDWLFFNLLLLHKKAIFTSQCTVGYRQHHNNIIGLKEVTESRLKKAISCKIEHYTELNKKGLNFEEELNKHLYFKEAIFNDVTIVETVLENINKRKLNLFWWEETNYLI